MTNTAEGPTAPSGAHATPIPERVAALPSLVLSKGSHPSIKQGACAMEAAAWMMGEDHNYAPRSVATGLSVFTRIVNDDLDDDQRQRLKALLPKLAGTEGDGHEAARSWMCVDWLVRTHCAAWLDLAGLGDAADALRGLPALTAPIPVDGPAATALKTVRMNASGALADRNVSFETSSFNLDASLRSGARAALGVVLFSVDTYDAETICARSIAMSAGQISEAAVRAVDSSVQADVTEALEQTRSSLCDSAVDLLIGMLGLSEHHDHATQQVAIAAV